MKAVIMAGGEGKRLRPLTCDRPKPMVYVANRPIMEHIVNLLTKHNITDIAVTLQYMPHIIKDYFQDGENQGVSLRYYTEKEPLGTAGSVKNAQEFLDETFIVISGDALTDIDITDALKFHKSKNAKVTMILKSVEVPLEYGVVVTDDNGKITKFLEKPNWGEVFSDTVNTGIYIIEPDVLSYIEEGFWDFGKDIFPKLLEQKIPMYGYVTKDYWCDIGDITSYRNAHKDILTQKVEVKIMGRQIAPNVWIGENVEINENSTIKSPCIIGNNVKIKKGAHIEKYAVIGDLNVIGKFTTIKQSVVWNNVVIHDNVDLRGCIIASNTELRDNVSVYEGSVIGNGCDILDYATIKPDVKVWPNKKVDKSSVLNEHLVWGSKHTKNIFGKRGINSKITPEYVTKLGMAYGSLINGKGTIAIASSKSNVSKLMKMAFLVGIMSTGVEVLDFGELLTPMLRLAVRFYKLDGGVYVNDKLDDGETIGIELLNQNGCNIETNLERKLTNIYNQEEFIKCDTSSVKSMVNIDEYPEVYMMDIINNIKCREINKKVVVNTSRDMVKSILTKVLEYMKCDAKFIDINSKEFLYAKKETQDIFSSFVKIGKFDLGIEIDDLGENLKLVDSSGRVIEKDMYQILIVLMQLMRGKNKVVVAPTTVSGVIENIAKEYGGRIRRTKSTVSELMKEMYKKDEPELLNQFSMYFDAVCGVVNILEFLEENNYTLEELYDMIPKFYMNKIEIDCKDTDKGKIIKRLIKDNKDGKMETNDGVKIYTKEGWVLILPSIEKSSVGIISEGFSVEAAQEICNVYQDKITRIIQGE